MKIENLEDIQLHFHLQEIRNLNISKRGVSDYGITVDGLDLTEKLILKQIRKRKLEKINKL